jgi:hypothetical protein
MTVSPFGFRSSRRHIKWVRCPLRSEATPSFLSLSLVIAANDRTPLSVAAEPLDGHEVEVLQRTWIEVRPHRLIEVFVAPAKALLASEQVASNPAFARLDFDAVLREGPPPNGPKNAEERSASVAVGEACRLDDHSFWRRSLPILGSFGDEVSAWAATLEEPAHVSLLDEAVSAGQFGTLSGWDAVSYSTRSAATSSSLVDSAAESSTASAMAQGISLVNQAYFVVDCLPRKTKKRAVRQRQEARFRVDRRGWTSEDVHPRRFFSLDQSPALRRQILSLASR